MDSHEVAPLLQPNKLNNPFTFLLRTKTKAKALKKRNLIDSMTKAKKYIIKAIRKTQRISQRKFIAHVPSEIANK